MDEAANATAAEFVREKIRSIVTDPAVATRTLALVSLAQYDTLAAAQQSPAYLVQLRAELHRQAGAA